MATTYCECGEVLPDDDYKLCRNCRDDAEFEQLQIESNREYDPDPNGDEYEYSQLVRDGLRGEF